MEEKHEFIKPSLGELCTSVLYIGATAYGGPAVLAQMKRHLVQKKHWLKDEEFSDSLSIAQVLPGATGVSIMGDIGYRFHKFWGVVLVPFFYILPAMLMILAASWAYFTYGDIPFVKKLFYGLGALVVALLINATLQFGQILFKKSNKIEYWTIIKGVIIVTITFVGVYYLHINPILLILLSGVLGFLLFYFTKNSSTDNPSKELNSPKEINKNDTSKLSNISTSHHSKKSFSKSVLAYLPLIILTAIILSSIIIIGSRELFPTFFQIGIFAFGGGFATIPLIQHIVVDQHQWISMVEFKDGIALGQITPGPVFITATFIGYAVYGLFGAFIATLSIFIPSIILMVLLSKFHGSIKHLKSVQVIVKGFRTGFIGLLLAVTLQFAFGSLISWQAWLIFTLGVLWIVVLKKEAAWAILATIPLALLIF